MTVLVPVELSADRVSLVSREALTFALEIGGDLHAVPLGPVGEDALADLRSHGVAVVHEASAPELSSYGGAMWGAVLDAAVTASGAHAVVAPGTPRGTEVLAHLAARRDRAMAANAVAVLGHEPVTVERQVAGGAVLETMPLDADLALLTMAGHAVEPAAAASPGAAAVQPLDVAFTEADLRARVSHTEPRQGGDTSGLTGAKVVVGAGRGAGGPDGFGDVDRLAARLGGAVGVSRVVTSLGWRPHHEQVGQTGSRISPDLYIACGISGAIQHWAGCQSSKVILAINTDEDAPMVTKATYAVIGDMHEVLPAVLDELG